MFFFFLFCYYFVNKWAKRGKCPASKKIFEPFFFGFVFLSKIFWCHCFIYCPSNNLFCRFVFFLGKRSKDKSCFFFNWVKPILIKSTDTFTHVLLCWNEWVDFFFYLKQRLNLRACCHCGSNHKSMWYNLCPWSLYARQKYQCNTFVFIFHELKLKF